jgi:hypothetical protein
MKKREVQIPFSGFYESYPMELLYDAVEQLDPNDEHHADIDYVGFAKIHVNRYAEELESQHGFALEMKFKDLERPIFYNHGADKIFVEVPIVQLYELYVQFCDDDFAQELINRRFKSRPGFASFYDDFCDNWRTKPLGNWDHNELAVLFDDLGIEDHYLYEDINCNGELLELITLS